MKARIYITNDGSEFVTNGVTVYEVTGSYSTTIQDAADAVDANYTGGWNVPTYSHAEMMPAFDHAETVEVERQAMDRLTDRQMALAISAAAHNANPNYDSGKESAIESALMPHDLELYTFQEKDKMVSDALAEYIEGNTVLSQYHINWSGRNTVGGSDAKNAENFLVVEAGWIAHSQAYRTARFYPKR